MRDAALTAYRNRPRVAGPGAARLNIADWSSFGLCLLFLTDYDAVFGYFSGIPSLRLTSTLLGLAGAIYLFLNLSCLLRLMRSSVVLLWSTSIFILPFVIILFQIAFGVLSVDEGFYFGGLNLLIGVIFLGAIILSYRAGPRQLRQLFKLAVIASVVGFFVQFAVYGIIREVMGYTSNRFYGSLRFDRLVGFFEHPNYAALSLFIYAFMIYALTISSSLKLRLSELVFMATCGFLVMATGSRTAFLVFVFFALLVWGGYVRSSRSLLVLSSRFTVTILSVFAGGVLLAILLSVFAGAESLIGFGLDRLNRFFDILAGEDVRDGSIDSRLSLLLPYLEMTVRAPILGHGPGASQVLIDSNVFGAVSQNSWVQWALDYGYVYVTFVAAVWTWSFLKFGWFERHENDVRRAKSRAVHILLVIMLFLTFSLGSLMTIKSLVVALGILFGQYLSDTARVNLQQRQLG